MHSIDILRAVAALAVVVYHARAEFWQGGRATIDEFGFATLRPDVWLSYASAPFALGWLGVPIFFALSGYCIHRSFSAKLARNVNADIDVISYYKRRFFRIYPVYIAALLLSGAVEYMTQTETGFAIWASSNLQTFLLNALMLQGLLSGYLGSNGVFWTLSVEFHLYLFYPLMFYFIKQYGLFRATLFAGLVSFVTAFLYDGLGLSTWFPHAANGSPLFTNHLLIWILGAYLAEIHTGRVKAVSGWPWTFTWVVALLVGIALQELDYKGWSAIFLGLGTFGLLPVLMAIVNKMCSDQTVTARMLYPIGIASYSLYATHVPVFRAIQSTTNGQKTDTILWALFCSVIAAIFSLVFFHFVERHTIRLPQFDPPRSSASARKR